MVAEAEADSVDPLLKLRARQLGAAVATAEPTGVHRIPCHFVRVVEGALTNKTTAARSPFRVGAAGGRSGR